MRLITKKLIAKEGLIIILTIFMAAICIGQRSFVEGYLLENRTYVDRAASNEQLYAILGFSREEIDSIDLLIQFRQNFPQHAGLDNWNTIPYFLLENPDFLHTNTLYKNIKSTVKKEEKIQATLKEQKQIDDRSIKIRKIGFIVLFGYPVFWFIRFIFWSLKILKIKENVS